MPQCLTSKTKIHVIDVGGETMKRTYFWTSVAIALLVVLPLVFIVMYLFASSNDGILFAIGVMAVISPVICTGIILDKLEHLCGKKEDDSADDSEE